MLKKLQKSKLNKYRTNLFYNNLILLVKLLNIIFTKM